MQFFFMLLLLPFVFKSKCSTHKKKEKNELILMAVLHCWVTTNSQPPSRTHKELRVLLKLNWLI